MRIGSCAGAPANAAMSAAVGLWAEVGRAEPGDPGDHGERGDEGQADGDRPGGQSELGEIGRQQHRRQQHQRADEGTGRRRDRRGA